MDTVDERKQFDAVQKHLETVRNYLHTVILPNETLLQKAMEEYALTLQTQKLRPAA